MRSFSDEIVSVLNSSGLGEPIHYIGLGAHDFQFGYGAINVRSYSKARLKIAGHASVWLGQPLHAPVWTLIGQSVAKVSAADSSSLSFSLDTGDEIEVFTDESPYEAVIVESSMPNWLDVF